MQHINPINQEISTLVREITSRIRDNMLLKRYDNSIKNIEQSKHLYISQLTNQRDKVDLIKKKLMVTDLPASEEDMKKLYKNYFVKSGFYGEIIQNADWCPYCEVRTVNTLDHFFPQKYTTLTVVSQNLVPACRDCNTKKRDLETHFFHPYYDKADWQSWLSVNLEFTDQIIPTYQCTKTLPIQNSLFNRIKSTTDILGLMELYQIYANSEVQENMKNWAYYFLTDKSILETTIENNISHSIHCWKGAFYQALQNQIEELCSFLKAFCKT